MNGEEIGEYITTELKKTSGNKIIVWQPYIKDGIMHITHYRLADNTEQQTIDEYKSNGWVVIERE